MDTSTIWLFILLGGAISLLGVTLIAVTVSWHRQAKATELRDLKISILSKMCSLIESRGPRNWSVAGIAAGIGTENLAAIRRALLQLRLSGYVVISLSPSGDDLLYAPTILGELVAIIEQRSYYTNQLADALRINRLTAAELARHAVRDGLIRDAPPNLFKSVHAR